MKNPFLLLSLPRQKKDPDDSPTWLIVSFVVFFLISTTRILKLNVVQDVEIDYEFGGTNIITTIFGNLILVATFIYGYKKRQKLLPVIKLLWPILLLYIWALISTVWSEIPLFTFKRVVKSLVMVTLVASIWLTNNPLIALRKSISLYAWFCSLASLFLIVFLPRYGWNNYEGGYLPCGIFVQKNGLGTFAGAMLIAIVWLVKLPAPVGFNKFPFPYKVLTILLLLELVMSRSMTAIVSLFLVSFIIAITLLVQKISNKRFLIMGSIFGILSIISFIILLSQGNLFHEFASKAVGLLGKDMTFTGRTEMWQWLISVGVAKHPWLGSGYGIFFLWLQNTGLLSNIGWDAAHAHNGYIQVFLELGIVGLILIISLIIVAFVRSFKMLAFEPWSAAFSIGILLLDIIFNFFEVGFMGTNLMFLLLICVSVKRNNNILVNDTIPFTNALLKNE